MINYDESPRLSLAHASAIAWGMPAGPCCIDQQRGEPLHPPEHRHVIDINATFGQ
jgi:hypothetical protein